MNNSFCTITPTRGDRNELLYFTISRIPAEIQNFTIDFKPKDDIIDIVPRVKEGVELAKKAGYEYAFIVEDDDWYPEYYFSDIEFDGWDFFGYATTNYYNLKNKTYQTFDHPERSSLFCTGFRLSAMDKFNWPDDRITFLDIRIWEYAIRSGSQIKLLEDNPCLGIKGHGVGKHAGKGHLIRMANVDNDLSYLRDFVDENAFEFYKELMKKV